MAMWKSRRRGFTPGWSAADKMAFVFGKMCILLAYELLHDQLERFAGTEERLGRISDAYDRFQQGCGCVPLHGRLRFEVGVDMLFVVDSATLQIEPHVHGTWQSLIGLEGSCTLKQTVYDMLQMLDQSHCI